MKKHNIAQKGKRALSMLLVALMVLSCWVWVEPNQLMAEAANNAVKDHYLFAYFTGTSKEGQTIHLAVSEDGYNYTALRGNDPVIIPSKGVGCVRDPYIWYNEQDNYYYILATDLDFTDSGSDYSNNSTGFIVWRSEDLITWHDETFIDVSRMAHLIGDTRNMSAVWAPQVLWDGSAYVVYFTLACNATSWFDIVYLKTTDIMDPSAYYEFDYILGNGTGNGVDNGYGVIDADIIHNPGDGKYYLFYKTETNNKELGTTSTGSSLKTIHYYVGDTPTGPFRNPGDTKWSNAGFSVFPNYNVSLEGCNSFWDNEGNLVMYVDEFEHTNALGEKEAYFHIAKSSGTNFKSWSYPNVSQHNINSLSPRHGSVVKITEAEYNRLLDGAYRVSSSSFSMDEELSDHLVGRFFTTSDVLHNDVNGKPDLDMSSNVTMSQLGGSYVANFSEGYATIDLKKLLPNSLNYDDGFTITFKAKMPTDLAENIRIYEIADIPGKRTGVEHYTHYSASGGGTGSYLGTYNGPDVAKKAAEGAIVPGTENEKYTADTHDWPGDINKIKRNDGIWHEYLISYANGNYIVYVDGVLSLMMNRHNTAVTLDDTWYKAIGQSTMYIGRSGFRSEYGSQYNDPDLTGQIRDFCIYDVSMSYYDLQDMDAYMKSTNAYTNGITYNGITSEVPTFQNTNADRMNALPNKQQHFSNILYTSNTVRNFDGNNMSADSAVWHDNGNDFNFALYYPETTVLLLDGINDAIMPVSFGAYCENSRASKGFLQIYPTTGPGSTTDLGELEISQNWAGWYNNGDYYNCIVEHADGYIGRNSSTSSWSHITDKKNYDCHWGAPLKVNEDKINFGDSYYKKFNLTWQVNGGVDGSKQNDHSANMTSDNAIYVIDFRPILELRGKITADEYNNVMNGNYCQALKEKYADAVFAIKTLNPESYNYVANAEVATKACGKAIKDAVNNYNGVMEVIKAQDASGNYGHETVILEERAPTCSVEGLTEGEYCTLCSEVLKEQKTISTNPHTFGSVQTDSDGTKYVQCSVCGIKLVYDVYEARYENLFSFNGWADSASAQVFSGTIETNKLNGTIKIVNQNNTEMYTRGHYDGQNLVSTRDFGNYCIPVVGGRTYYVEATSLASSTSKYDGVEGHALGGEVFVFQYDKDGRVFSSIPVVLGVDPGQTNAAEFTVDQKAAYIELRFDCNYAGKTITYSNIGVYEVDSYEKFAGTTLKSRIGFYPGENKQLDYPIPGAGYAFNGWRLKDGNTVANVNSLNIVTNIVYGSWYETGFEIAYDSIFNFSEWAKTSCNMLWYGDIKNSDGSVTRLVDANGVETDVENATITLTNDEDTTYFARTNYWVYNDAIYKMPIETNTEYILEYTATSDDGAKPSICLYLTGGTAQYPETGNATRYSTGTHYYRFNSGDNINLALRFDNVQNGSTVTYSNIAVYKADFEEAARTITNRQYRRYYENGDVFGNLFEYTPVRTGYTFKTWWADIDGTVNGFTAGSYDGFDCSGLNQTTGVDNNYHVFSEWTENSYTIKYDANGGTGSTASSTQKYTANVTLPTSGFTKVGYTFVGWSTKADATTATYQAGQGVSRLSGENGATVTLYAIWTPNTYTVKFDGNGATSGLMEDQKMTYGTAANLKENKFSKTGYTFAGWKKSGLGNDTVYADKQSVSNLTTQGNGTVTLIAQWTANPYTVTFYANNGTQDKITQNLTYDTAGNLATNTFEKTGYEFKGWSTTANGEVEYTDGQEVTNLPGADSGSVALYAVWKVKTYQVTLNAGEGSCTPTEITVTYDSEYGTLPTPTRTGYTFDGWYYNGSKITSTTTVSVASNHTLTAKWTAKTYTVTLNAGEGSCTPTEITVTYDSAYGTLPTPTRTGYEFLGWYYNGSKIEASTIVSVTSNHTFTAEWELGNEALVTDKIALDFGLPMTFNPVANDAIFLEEVGSDYTLSVDSADGKLTKVDNETLKYTPSGVMTSIETYNYTVAFGNNKTLTGTIKIGPASNVYYEENMLTETDNGSVAWSEKTPSTEKSLSKDDKTVTEYALDNVYGYEELYDNTNKFSNGTYWYAGVTSSASRSHAASFTFTGTGFDLVSACGANTGMQSVVITDVATGKRVKNYLVDTYYSETSTALQPGFEDLAGEDGLIHQVPIVSFRSSSETAKTYTVTITAMYLATATAVKKGTAQIALSSGSDNGAVINAQTGKPSKALINELESLGFDDGGEEIELLWMDKDSVFNGGDGGRQTVLGGSAKTALGNGETTKGLANYIDGFRVYRNGYKENYIASEQNPTYFNIVEQIALTNPKNFDLIKDNTVDFNFDQNFDYTSFRQSGGPKGEIYLQPGQAIAFTFNAVSNGTISNVMLGMNAVNGTTKATVYKSSGTTATPYDKPIDINTATEMYYDISDAGIVDGGTITLAIANTGSSVLSVNNLKLVDGTGEITNQVQNPNGSLIMGGNTASDPLAPTPDASTGNQDDAGDTSEDALGGITSMIPGMPASITSFLELLFKLITQLLGSFGF